MRQPSVPLASTTVGQAIHHTGTKAPNAMLNPVELESAEAVIMFLTHMSNSHLNLLANARVLGTSFRTWSAWDRDRIVVGISVIEGGRRF